MVRSPTITVARQALKQVILIMTTNVGADSISPANSMGFTKQDHSRDNSETMKRMFTQSFAIVWIPSFNLTHWIKMSLYLWLINSWLNCKPSSMTRKWCLKLMMSQKLSGRKRLRSSHGCTPMNHLIQDEIKNHWQSKYYLVIWSMAVQFRFV